jgi:hypothetical protein
MYKVANVLLLLAEVKRTGLRGMSSVQCLPSGWILEAHAEDKVKPKTKVWRHQLGGSVKSLGVSEATQRTDVEGEGRAEEKILGTPAGQGQMRRRKRTGHLGITGAKGAEFQERVISHICLLSTLWPLIKRVWTW